MKACYPVILSDLGKDPGYLVYIPDFDSSTSGKDLADAMFMARDAISLLGITLEDEHREVPKPSEISSIKCKAGETVTLVDVDFTAYRQANDNRSIRKNCTIPAWLNDKAEKAGLNFSALLQRALKAELNITE